MIAITIDCEEWNYSELRNKQDSEFGKTQFSYDGNNRLLKIFLKNNIHSTFFITGTFAKKNKAQVKEISKSHEVGCHGYRHFYRKNKNLNLNEDVLKSKKIIESIIKKKVYGFRAPQMQFSENLIKILKKYNFKYDSSIHAANLPGFYNNKKFPLKPFRIFNFKEIPASASYTLRLPISWIFFRNLPLVYSVAIVKKLIKKGIIPVLYFHSWEFTKMKIPGVPFYITRNTGEKLCKKLEKFLKKFKDEKFVLMKDIT